MATYRELVAMGYKVNAHLRKLVNDGEIVAKRIKVGNIEMVDVDVESLKARLNKTKMYSNTGYRVYLVRLTNVQNVDKLVDFVAAFNDDSVVLKQKTHQRDAVVIGASVEADEESAE
jgi:hypothetical protein